MTRKLIWAIALVALLMLAALAALPGLVASRAHRGTIEALASSLTGREVHIGGRLSLALLPSPQLIADNVTIGGPDAETITAKSLTLDMSATALLRGRLTASSITLQSPLIALPWPLRGGPASVAPPAWLTALHAQINDGRMMLGGLEFDDVSADVFTSTGGAVSVSGTGRTGGHSVNVSFSLGATAATGAAPLSIDLAAVGGTAHLSGAFAADGSVSGDATVTVAAMPAASVLLAGSITATGQVQAANQVITISNLRVTQGEGQLAGTATFDPRAATLDLILTGSNLAVPGDMRAGTDVVNALRRLSVHLVLDVDEPLVAGVLIPHVHVVADADAGAVRVPALDVTLPSDGRLHFGGAIDGSDVVMGHFSFAADDMSTMFSAFGGGAAMPADWRQMSLAGTLAGPVGHLAINAVSGTLGSAHLVGSAVYVARAGGPVWSGAVHFDQLDLAPIIAGIGHIPAGMIAGNLDLTADRANLGRITMTHLLVDAGSGLPGHDAAVVVRRLTASLYGGFLAASFTAGGDGRISAAQAVLSVPTAAALAGLLPGSVKPPPGLLNAPLALAMRASGPAGALAADATMTLGDFSVSAAPVLDIAHQTASGAFLLRDPSAIAAFNRLGLGGGIGWPGAGSLSLRADFVLSAARYGLPDFVLSLGDLTATGRLIMTNGNRLDGSIAADTLALPPPPDVAAFWNLAGWLQGNIALSANRVLLAGTPILATSSATVSLAAAGARFTLTRADFGGGDVTGTLAIDLPGGPTTGAPRLSGDLTVRNVDASAVAIPGGFALSLPSGTVSGQATLTATGYTARAWLATLGGSAGFSAVNGSVLGFDLAALDAALGTPAVSARAAALKAACIGGTTNFSSLAMAGHFVSGIYVISNAALQGEDGQASAGGTIDLPDQNLSLNLALLPAVPVPPQLTVGLAGGFANPHRYPGVKAGLAWQAP